jgi:hypothetical protein
VKAVFGASFSAKYCRELGIHPQDCLRDALTEMGVRRLRLMSYWDECEKVRGTYDFGELDWQFDMAEKHGAEVTLCLGLRQPRWPESHWPAWAKELPKEEWQAALLAFIEAVVRRYKTRPNLASYQLENEARLKKFGQDGDFDRGRLKAEFKLVKMIDPIHPVLMSVSDSWGIPVFGPRPDAYGFSIYRYFFDRGEYRRSTRPPLFFTVRALLIRLLKWRRVFIHELQAEPWGPRATADMSLQEQLETMSIDRLRETVAFAGRTRLKPVDIWGLEWWFYLKAKHNHQMVWSYFSTVYGGKK